MVKNADQCLLKPKMSSSNVSFCSQPEDIQFTVMEEEKKTEHLSWNQRIAL